MTKNTIHEEESSSNGAWELFDPRPVQSENPYTFFVPSDAEKDLLEEGDHVKLIFDSLAPENGSSERMWVQFQRRENDEFYGVLDNQPYGIEGLNLGDAIQFKGFHIVSVGEHKLDETSDEGRYFARCHVDQRILQEGAEISHLERRKPKWVWWWKRKQQMFPDTGWHIFAEQDSTDAKIEMQYVAIGVVLNKNDGFLNFLGAATGTRLRRDGDNFLIDA